MKIPYIVGGIVVIIIIISLISNQSSHTSPTTGEFNEHTMQDGSAMMGDTMPRNDSTDETTAEPVQKENMTETDTMSGMMHENMELMKTFNVTGTNFAYDLKEIRVKEGDTVMLHLMSGEGTHDLVIDEYNVKTDVVRDGGMTMATFVADKKGTFEYYCSIGKHRANGMVGKLIVE